MKLSLNQRLFEITKIDNQITGELTESIIDLDLIRDLKRQRRGHVIAIQHAPRGKTAQ